MSLTFGEIHRVAGILARMIVGGRIQDIRQPTPDTLTLSIRLQGKTVDLFVSVRANQASVHTTALRWPNSATPSGFLAKLRKEVVGCAIDKVENLPSDRIIELKLFRPVGHESDQEFRLIVELTGLQCNVFLVDMSGRIVTQMRSSRSKQRPLQPGNSYVFPAPNAHHTANDRFAAYGDEELFGAIEAHYQKASGVADRRDDWLRATKLVNSSIKRIESTILKISADAEKAAGSDRVVHHAELVKSVLHTLTANTAAVTVTDWYDPQLQPVTVELDPTIDPAKNVEKMFHRARRMRNAASFLDERLQKLEITLEHLLTLRHDLANMEHEGDLSLVSERLAQLGLVTQVPQTRNQGTGDTERTCYRAFESRSGHAIWVGKSAKDNDTLTVKLARSHDVWLHATGRRGAHVVLRTKKNEVPPPDALADAAALAAHYSEGGPGNSGIEVAWTLVKHVRKSKKSAPGSVTYSQERTIWVTPNAERLRRLFQNDVPLPATGKNAEHSR